MTTPRVTVPVERAEYERLICVTEDLIREVSDPGTEALAAVYCARRILDQSAMLSAAPAVDMNRCIKCGAGPLGNCGYYDCETPRNTCPLATREVAPAEAGEANPMAGAFVTIEAVGSETPDFRKATIHMRFEGPEAAERANTALTYLSQLHESALRAQPQAREQEGGTLDPAFVAWLKERDCLPNDDDGTIEWADIVCALNDWEADLTQAREDAQPVAYGADHQPWCQPGDQTHRAFRLRFEDPDMREMVWTGPDAEREALAAYNQYAPAWNVYLFSGHPRHPAPEALRVAVEALGQSPAIEALTPTNREWVECVSVQDRYDLMKRCLRQALTALQAEQKGGPA